MTSTHPESECPIGPYLTQTDTYIGNLGFVFFSQLYCFTYYIRTFIVLSISRIARALQGPSCFPTEDQSVNIYQKREIFIGIKFTCYLAKIGIAMLSLCSIYLVYASIYLDLY